MAASDACFRWVLEPVAEPADPAWQDRIVWRRVVVLARSAAFARLAAERWATAEPASGPGNESPSPAAGFSDTWLYRVRRLDDGAPVEASVELAADGVGRVVEAEPWDRSAAAEQVESIAVRSARGEPADQARPPAGIGDEPQYRRRT